MMKNLCIAALLLVPVGTAFGLHQQKKATEATAPVDDPMMVKWTEFMTPGAAHRQLNHKVGKWTGKTTLWMEPAGTPTESTCTAEFTWILGDRYLQDKTSGDFNGQPFQGIGTTGFDNMKKKYVSTWIDNMGTGFMVSEGTYDAASKTFNFMGSAPDVMQGKYVKSRSVEKIIDTDHWVLEMFSTAADGKEFKNMEIKYARAK